MIVLLCVFLVPCPAWYSSYAYGTMSPVLKVALNSNGLTDCWNLCIGVCSSVMRGAHHRSGLNPVSEMTYTVSSGTLNSTIHTICNYWLYRAALQLVNDKSVFWTHPLALSVVGHYFSFAVNSLFCYQILHVRWKLWFTLMYTFGYCYASIIWFVLLQSIIGFTVYFLLQ